MTQVLVSLQVGYNLLENSRVNAGYLVEKSQHHNGINILV